MDRSRASGLEAAHRLDLEGRHGEAEAAYRAFLAGEPRHAGAWSDLGGLLMIQDRLDEAQRACLRALRLQPGQPSALVNLGCVRARQGRFQEAEGLIRQALEHSPGDLAARHALTDTLMRAGAYARARIELARTLDLDPANLSAHQALGHILHLHGEWEAYRRELRRFAQAVPDAPYAAYEQGYLDLLEGDFAAGWRGWEARLRVPGLVGPRRAFREPAWDGSPFPGRTLLLHHEQGLGDTLMFLRLAALAKAQGGRVICEVQPPLVSLAATCPGVDEVVAHGSPLPPFDLQLSLLSLPALLGLGPDGIPCDVPYLAVPPEVPHREDLLCALEPERDVVRIGLVWAGSRQHKNDRARSLPPALLAPLGDLPGAAFFSFQLGSPEACPIPGTVVLAPHLGDFADTAFALSAMDLLITVDTAPAHLAGALGVPTLLLLPFGPDWRWLLDRDGSPWYPTLRLYRQPAPGDWTAVIAAVRQDLAAAEA